MLKKSFWFSALGFCLVLLGYSLWKRPIHVDDGWLAEHAFYLNQLGYVKSEALRGWLTVDQKLFVYHKLFAYVGAGWADFFGFGPYALKSLSLLFLGLSVFVLLKIYRNLSDVKTNGVMLVVLFLSFHHVLELGFTYRPEMMLTFFALVAFWGLSQYLQNHSRFYLVMGAIASGAAIAGHLNGVIVVGAGVLTLWTYRRYAAGFWFGAIGAWGLLFYFVDVRSLVELQTLLHQFRNTREVSNEHFGWFHYILNIILEQQRFLHSLPEIIYTVLILAFFALRKGMQEKKGRWPLVYAGYMTLLLALIAHGKTAKYLLYCSPFFFLWTVSVYEGLKGSKMKIAHGVMAFYLVVSWGYDIQFMSRKESLYPDLLKVAEVLPANARVLADTHFFFASQGKFRVQTRVNYDDAVERKQMTASGPDFFKMALDNEIEYVVLDHLELEKFHITGPAYSSYVLMPLPFASKLTVYKRQ